LEFIVPQDLKDKVGFWKTIIWIESLSIEKPTWEGNTFAANLRLYPSECREAGTSYASPLFASVSRKIDNETIQTFKVKLGDLPIMVGSKFCNLYGLNERELVERKEDLS